jgi:hypothetical protein
MSLKLARPSGMPMIVMQRRTPLTTCPRASHHPHSSNQTTLPMAEATPASSRRTTVRPKGQRQSWAIRKAATPKWDRDDQDEHEQRRERVGDRQPEAGEHQPDDVEQDPHAATLLPAKRD